jgi:hypothetical protein
MQGAKDREKKVKTGRQAKPCKGRKACTQM